MRELKFRVWDEKNKQFADYEDIEECLSCQSREGWEASDGVGCCFGINAVEVLADCIIEQYTGLKDKNGKEIYEGDIIREIVDDGEEHVTEYEVVWNNELLNFSLKWKPSGSNFHEELWECNKSIEVIGNIHENLESLGGEE